MTAMTPRSPYEMQIVAGMLDRVPALPTEHETIDRAWRYLDVFKRKHPECWAMLDEERHMPSDAARIVVDAVLGGYAGPHGVLR